MLLKQIDEAVSWLQERTSFTPATGIILGTGLGALAEEVEVKASFSYAHIPHFPVSTVEAHKGKLLFGTLEGAEVVVMQGRFHYYEGYTMQQIAFPVRVMKELGIEQLYISNAAGGLDPDHNLSDLMLITDHINLFPGNPLIGQNLDRYGIRFPDMSEPYSLQLQQQARKSAAALNLKLREGVYAGVSGPNLETRAEYRFLRTIGADAVGMSTIPEVIAAVHMSLPVLAISVITDLCSPAFLEKVTLEKVIAAAAKAEPNLLELIKHLLQSRS